MYAIDKNDLFKHLKLALSFTIYSTAGTMSDTW